MQVIRKEVGKEEPCNTTETGSQKVDFVKKSTSIFMTIPNENMKKIDNYVTMLKSIDGLRYILVGKHDGPKLEHYHIYAQYSSNHTFHAADFDYAHIKKIKSAIATVKYIKCEDKKHIKKGVQCDIYLEEGEPPHQGRKALKELMKLSNEERKELPPCQYLSLVKCENLIKEDEAVDSWLDDQKLEVEWHTGQPGTGKTHYAKQVGKYYRKLNKDVAIIEYDKNGFAHKIGKDSAELLILNEFRDSCMKFTDFLEITSNEHQYNCKHGSFFMKNLKKIIITSVQKPNEIYKNIHENREQIYRRITKTIEHYKRNQKYESIIINTRTGMVDNNESLEDDHGVLVEDLSSSASWQSLDDVDPNSFPF